jgi:hypothetical protein
MNSSNWFSRIVKDITLLPDMVAYYNKELSDARKEVKIKGSVELNVAQMPGLTETRFTQLQEIEAILNHLNIQLRQLQQTYYKKYLESYNKALSSRDAEKYAQGESEVCDFECLVNEVAFIRNQYLSILKALECKNFMLGHITKLRCAGLENITINEK